MRSRTRQLGMVVVVLFVTGCARPEPDWIERMLVTVDVAGTWSGAYIVERAGGGTAEFILEQTGPNVTGVLTHRGSPAMKVGFGGTRIAVRGTVNGDVFRLSGTGLEFELVVQGERISGSFAGDRTGTIDLIRVAPRDQPPAP